MPKTKYKVMCPGKAHAGYGKFLFGCTLKNGVPDELVLHCGHQTCRRWFKVQFSGRGGVKVTEMPENYHFDFERMPALSEKAIGGIDAD